MYSIKLNIDDNILDKVMFFLNNIPKESIEVTKVNNMPAAKQEKLGDFFHNSPLTGEVSIERLSEIYKERVVF